MVKHPAQGHFDLEPTGYLRADGYAQQRVSAQIEEVVLDAHPIPAQHCLPDLRQAALQFIARSHVVRARS
jgi:hypothetical protein